MPTVSGVAAVISAVYISGREGKGKRRKDNDIFTEKCMLRRTLDVIKSPA